jgi:hypothetical protein
MKIGAGNANDNSGQGQKDQEYFGRALKWTAAPAYIHTFVLDSIEIAEPFECCGPCFFRRHATCDVFTQQQVNVKSQLFFNFEFELSAVAKWC